MAFGLLNAPTIFQRCMISIFVDMVEYILEVFMDDFSIVGDVFNDFLEKFSSVPQRYEELNIVLN